MTKVSSAHSPTGDQGQVYLASGKRVSMRLWRDEQPTQDKPAHRHDYEVVGYVIAGRAELETEGQIVRLEAGDSWVVRPAPSTPIGSWNRSRPWRRPHRRPRSLIGSGPEPRRRTIMRGCRQNRRSSNGGRCGLAVKGGDKRKSSLQGA